MPPQPAAGDGAPAGLTSMVFASRRSDGLFPGRVQVVSATPRVPTFSDAEAASATTCAGMQGQGNRGDRDARVHHRDGAVPGSPAGTKVVSGRMSLTSRKYEGTEKSQRRPREKKRKAAKTNKKPPKTKYNPKDPSGTKKE